MTEALILIDIQKAFYEQSWESRSIDSFEKNIAALIQKWRADKAPIIHIRHNSLVEGSLLKQGLPSYDFMDCARPMEGEQIVTKHVNSAFIGTNLESILQEMGVNAIVIAGLSSDHCVSTSVRMAANLGFKVKLVYDGTATFKRDLLGESFSPEIVHKVALASLSEEFCEVVQTSELL